MKKIITLFAFISILCSCDNTSDPIVEEKKEYELTDIKYYLGEGDGMLIDTIRIDKRVFHNNSSTQAVLTINYNEISNRPAETFLFRKDEETPPLSRYSNDSKKISIPYYIDNNTIFLDASQSYEYVESTQSEITNNNQVEWKFDITPYTQYTIEINVVINQTTTHYTATFSERKTRETISVNGQWKGTRVKGHVVNVQADEIK